MSQCNVRIKGVNGFKFSFKRDGNSARSTPKFASIELDSGDLQQEKPKQIQRKERPTKRSLKKMTQSSTHIGKQKEQLNITGMSKSHKNINYGIEGEQSQIAFNNSERVFASVDNKKMQSNGRPTKTDIIKNQSFERLLKQPLNIDEEQRQAGSYLQIFRREKKKIKFSKANLSTLNLSLKKSTESINFFDKKDQSPKSINSNRSFRQTPKIFNKFFPKNDEIEQLIDDAAIFPQTTKSKRFNEEIPSYFPRKNETKKNMAVSKALFKSQKTNLNVRLNNIGGAFSKLNIRID